MSHLSREQELEREIAELREKLSTAQNWMRREIEAQIKKVVQEKDVSSQEEEEISEKIQCFFSDILLVQTPETVLENLIMSEVEFELLSSGSHIDPVSTIVSYQKVLDACIEKFITQDFRTFAIAKKCTELTENQHLEKAFHSIIHDHYIFGVNKFFLALKKVKQGGKMLPYLQCFSDFLNQEKRLKKILLGNDFQKYADELLQEDFF